MRRGIVVLLALLGSWLAVPASAAAPAVMAYEVVRTATAPAKAKVKVHYPGGDDPFFVVLMTITPDDEGGYRWYSAMSVQGDGGSGWAAVEADLSKGRRLLVGALGRSRVEVTARGWSVRKLPRAMRVAPATVSPGPVAGVPLQEPFRATAPGGAYGSVAFADVSCVGGVATWTFASDTEPWRGPPETCVSGSDHTIRDTRDGRRWTLEGSFSGVPLRRDQRLIVLDYPKAPSVR